MKKHTPTLLANHLSDLDPDSPFKTHPLMDWVSRHGKSILYGILGGFIVLFMLSLWLLRDHSEASKGYFETISAFQSFEKASTPEKQATSLGQLNKLLDRYPDLHALYDGNIAQTLINRDQALSAKPFATATLKRTHQDLLPAFSEYAQISLLISNSDFTEALQRSIALKQKLVDHKEIDSRTDMLFAFNLLRTGFLQQVAGTPAEEIKSWQAWKQYAGILGASEKHIDTQPFALVAGIFVDGKLSLENYIDARIKTLEASPLQNSQQKLQ